MLNKIWLVTIECGGRRTKPKNVVVCASDADTAKQMILGENDHRILAKHIGDAIPTLNTGIILW